MTNPIPSNSTTYDPTIASSPPTGCPFHQRSVVGGVTNWALSTYNFFNQERLEFARSLLKTDTQHIYKDYEWTSIIHSPNALFITDPHMINEIVSKVRDNNLLSGGLEFQYVLTQGTGTESPLTITDDQRHLKLQNFCKHNEFGFEGIKASMSSIAEVALDFVQRLPIGLDYNATQNIPVYSVTQASRNLLKSDVDISTVPETIANVEKCISDYMLLHVKNIIQTQLQHSIEGNNSFHALEKIAKEVVEDENAEGIIRKMIDSEEFTEDEINSLARTILFIGSGTTKSAIISALYCLMRDPQLQEELHASIKDIVLTNLDGNALYKQLDTHEKLNCFLLEVLRLFPPILFQIRNTKEAYTFTYNGVQVPAGTSIYMSLVHSYRDERRWENPEKCDPSRFKKTTDAKTANVVHKLHPFSMGHTKCIGEKFARTTIKMLLIALLQSFRVISPPDMEEQHLKIEGGMTLKFNKPLILQFEIRSV